MNKNINSTVERASAGTFCPTTPIAYLEIYETLKSNLKIYTKMKWGKVTFAHRLSEQPDRASL